MAVENVLSVRLQQCAKTFQEWYAINNQVIPKKGEICLEYSNHGTDELPDFFYKMKIGDGKTKYMSLKYFPISGDIIDIIVDWVNNNLDVNEYAQAEYNSGSSEIVIYGIKETDGKISKGSSSFKIAAGNMINLSELNNSVRINHSVPSSGSVDTSSSGGNTNNGVVTDVTRDGYGHVTGVTKGSLPSFPTIGTVLAANQQSVTDAENPVINPYLNQVVDSRVVSHHQVEGGSKIGVNSVPLENKLVISHSTTARTDNEETTSPNKIITGVTTDSYGHVTGTNYADPDDLTVGLAKDIDSPVKQVDDNTWNHRTTGGDITIGEDVAKIDTIKGNTLIWNQLFKELTSTNWVVGSGNASVTFDNGVVTLITGSSGTNRDLRPAASNRFTLNHKYLISFTAKSDINSQVSISSYTSSGNIFQNIYFQLTTSFSKYAIIASARMDGNCDLRFTNATSNAVTYTIKELNLIDLTKMFGAGNEPSTVEEFESVFPLDYYGNNEGELLSFKGNSIVSKDTDNNTLGTVGINTTTLTGKLNGAGSSVTIFPDGMKSAGTVHDELTETTAIKRIGVVNLGTLNWSYYALYDGFFFANIPSMKPGYANGVMIKYENLYDEATYTFRISNKVYSLNNHSLFGSTYTYISIKDSEYSNASDLKASLSNIYLYYELETPEEYILDNPLNFTYPVDDLGTETLLPENTSTPVTSPFRGEIEYQSNFKDAVKELIDKVNSYTNPVKGINDVNQTVDELAIYDSPSTVKSSGYTPSNGTITDSNTDNDKLLPTVSALVNYVRGLTTSALHYKGTINSYGDLEQQRIRGVDVGYVFACRSAFTLPTSTQYLDAGTYDSGDFFIWNGSKWDAIQGHVRVVNNNATLTLNGVSKTVANIEGTDVTVQVPDLNATSPSSSGSGIDFIDTVSQTNGLISATKKSVRDATTSQTGVVQLASSIHNGVVTADEGRVVTAGQVWTELSARNVHADIVQSNVPVVIYNPTN